MAAETITTGHIADNPRRLRTPGMIDRIPQTHRYTFTEQGWHTAMLLSAVHDRHLPTRLAHLADHATSPPLREAARTHPTVLENISHTTELAAQPHNTTQPVNSKSRRRLRQPAQHGLTCKETPIRGPIVTTECGQNQ